MSAEDTPRRITQCDIDDVRGFVERIRESIIDSWVRDDEDDPPDARHLMDALTLLGCIDNSLNGKVSQ